MTLKDPAAPTAAPRERNHEIDLLRGLACVSVVLFHFLHRGQLDDWIRDHAPRAVDQLAAYGYLGVHLFFIISGYVILMSAEGGGARAFVASRVARLYPAYWVAAALTAGLAWALQSPSFQVGWREFLVNLTMLTHLVWLHGEPPYVDGAYWSLAVEFQFYLLMLAVLLAGALARIEGLMAGWLLLSSLDFLRPMYLPELLLALKWAPLFCAGMLFRLIRQRGLDRRRYLMLWWCHFLVLARATTPEAMGWGGGGRETWGVALLLTLFFLVFWLIAARRWAMRASPLTVWAGLLTYPVYLLHQNIGYMLLEQLRPLWPSFAGRLALVLALVTLLAVLVQRGVERPLGAWLRRRLSPPRALPARAQAPGVALGHPQPSR